VTELERGRFRLRRGRLRFLPAPEVMERPGAAQESLGEESVRVLEEERDPRVAFHPPARGRGARALRAVPARQLPLGGREQVLVGLRRHARAFEVETP
jgi:hypothetical protein